MEHTYSREDYARAARRDLINKGYAVSLLSFDSSRDINGLYVFDSYERELDTESRFPITDPRTGKRTGL